MVEITPSSTSIEPAKLRPNFEVFRHTAQWSISRKHLDRYGDSIEYYQKFTSPFSATILMYLIKALNDTGAENKIVSSSLVFGGIATLRTTGAKLPNQEELMAKMKKSLEYAATAVSERKITRALKANLPPSATYSLSEGDKFMAYSENRK